MLARQGPLVMTSSNSSAFPFLRALANLYEDPEWSQKDLAGPTELLKTQVTKSKLGALAPSQLWRYRQELAERARLGHPACFTNLWALINEALLHDKVGRGVGPGLVKLRQSHLEMGPSWVACGKDSQHREAVDLGCTPSLSPMNTNSQINERP